MKKNTQLLRSKTRWLGNYTLFLLLLLLIPLNKGNAQTYCTPSYTDGCSWGDDLNSFKITGHGTSVINDLNTGCTSGGYLDNSTTIPAVDLLPGQSYTVEMNTNYSAGWENASIWIDFNNDGTFDDATEKLLTDLSLNTSPSFSTASIAIPVTASSGIRRMRVRVVYSTTGVNACANASYGEAHDYSVNILSLTPCSGAVAAGVATASDTSVCAAIPFNLSLNGATVGGGVTYQWQSSPAGANTWTDISGATNMSYIVANQTAATDYRCIVTCTNSNTTDTSTVVSVGQNSITQCYCTPTYSYACSNTSENINSFILVGEGTSNITDLNTGCSTGNYQDRISSFSPVDLLQDGAYTVQINTNYSSGSSVWANLWIDFNDNGVFETTEQLMKDVPMATSPAFMSHTIIIPASADPGVHRMRVRANYFATITACANGSWGETHDYEVNIIPVTCYRPTITSVVKASATSVDVDIAPSVLNTGTVNYEYEVRTSGLPGSGPAGFVTSGTSASTTFTVGGLQAGIVYTIYVRTDCGGNDYSQYSSYEFGIPASLPYTQGFEGVQHGWVLANGGLTNEWVVGNAVSNGGANSLYISNDQGATNAYTISSTTTVHAYKDFELPSGVSDISIAFDWRALAESCCDYIRAWIVPSTFKPTPGTQITSATGRVQVAGNLNMDDTFKRFQKIQSATAYTGTFRIVFEWRNDGSVGTMPAAAIDNIEIKPVTCYEPLTMVLSNITEQGVTVTLTPDPKNTGTVTYQYEVRTSGTPGSGATGRVATGTSTTPVINITNLPADTNYQIYVRTACSSSDFSFWKEGSFKTLEVLAIDVVQVNIDCYGADNGSVSITTTGGRAPYTYLWTPTGATTASVTNLTPGAHSVIVSDDSGQVINRTFTILEPTAVVSNMNITQVSCNGANNGSVTVAPSGGVAPYTVLWSDNTVGTTKSNLAPGTYSVTIRDANNCVLTEPFTITEPVVLATTISSQTNVSVYGGNDGAATITVTGGTSPYTYSWSPSGGTAASATNLVAGIYTVDVTDANGCTTTQTVTITQPQMPYEIELVSLTNITCNGANDGSITVQVNGGAPPYTYSWDPVSGNSPTISNLSSGTYDLTVTDALNTVITEQFTITEPLVLSGAISSVTNITCNGAANGTATATATGGTAPYSYMWSNGMNTATANNLMAGNYSVTITDANGCTTTDSITITEPSALVVTGTSIDISCFGQNDGSISITVSGGEAPYTYLWSNAQTGTSISGLSGGVYTVTVTDANGCTQVESFTIVEPAFVHPPVATNQNFCIGQNATLNDIVITGSNIKWYNAAVGGTLLPGTTILTTGTTYYASQTVGTCESSTRTAVQITLNQGTPLTTTQLNVCSNTRIQNMTIDGFNYTQLQWYTSPTSSTVLPSSHLLATQIYYVSSVIGTCVSPRQAIQVTVAATVPAPTVVSPQTACVTTTLNDLDVTKDPNATLRWYSSTQSMTPLANTTVVSSGTYYVQQVIGDCESLRVAVSVQVVNPTAPAMTSINTCEGNTIGDLNTNTTKYVWYTDNSTSTPLPDTYVITPGTYYIAQEVSGCISSRTSVLVTVNERPASPTGPSQQTVGVTKRVSDLITNEPDVHWYASYSDAMIQNNELPKGMPLQSQMYYGILIGSNGCGSLPFAVEVTVSLSTQELDLTQLSYYPNPAESELNISYIEDITKVEIFSITGQKVLSKEFDSNEIKVDLTGLSSGTYMVRVQTDKASQFIKIIKK